MDGGNCPTTLKHLPQHLNACFPLERDIRHWLQVEWVETGEITKGLNMNTVSQLGSNCILHPFHSDNPDINTTDVRPEQSSRSLRRHSTRG